MVVMRTGDVRQGLFDGDWSGAAADSNRFAAVRISGRSGSPGGHKEDALLLAAATASGKETYWMQVSDPPAVRVQQACSELLHQQPMSVRACVWLAVDVQYQLQRATVQDGDQRLRENSSGQALVAPPGPLQPLSATRGTAHGVALRHTREVQAVTALLLEGSATTFVGSIDAAGRAGVTAFPMVGGAAGGHESGGKEAEDVTVEGGAEGGRGAKRRRVRGSGDGGGTSSSSSSAAAAATWWMEPQRDSLGRGMDGWAGLALSHSHVGGGGGASGLGGLSVATAHCWSKRLSFYSEGAPTPHRTVCTYHHPADLCFVDAAAQPGGTPAPGGDDGGGVGQLVAVAENHHLSIWDARVAEHGGGAIC
jgi:hypothetical protein